jgi:aminopeptidase N
VKNLLLLILVSFLLTSCFPVRFHRFGEVPKKAGHYPRFTEEDYQAGFLDDLRAGYDVSFYDLNLILDPDKKKISGEVNISFKALKKLKTFRFNLYNDLDIRSIKFQGRELPGIRNKRVVDVVLPDSLETGRDYSVIVTYEGKPQVAKKPPWRGGMVWKKDKDGNPWIGVTCETDGASLWFPCKDHLSDEPDSVRLHMTVPSGLQVISNGIPGKHISEAGKETFTWSTHYPLNIYNITFYAGRFEHFSDTINTPQGVLSLDYYVLPANLTKAKDHFRQVKDVIGIYSKTFGPYPWIKEGFKLVESPFEGMEHQTAIAYGSGYSNMPLLGGDYIIVHETAHEWWGNAVSVSDFSDIWLQEGFATYSEMVYAEKKKGYDSSLIYARYWLGSTINNKLPVVGPKDVNYWDYKDGDVYTKGALILNTIRNIVNDSVLFFDILQTFYFEHAALSHVTTSDFKKLVELKTGKNWDKFFEAYLYNRKIPFLKWYVGYYQNDKDQSNKTSEKIPFAVARWINVPEGFSMPVTIDCSEGGDSETIQVTTSPEVFYLRGLKTCSAVICNKRQSYFGDAIDPGVLKEFEALVAKTK